LNVETANVRSASSELNARGSVGWDGTAALDIKLTSQELAEVQRAVESFGVIPTDVREQVQVDVVGKGEFNGRLVGKLDSPILNGHLTLETINSGDELLGRFEGDISYQRSLLRIENSSLSRPDGSRVDFTVNAPLVGENNIAVNATVQDFDLAALVRAADPRFNEFVSSGAITGTIDLTGLPGPRTIDGTANVVLSAAEFTVPAEEEGKDPKRISVPEFKGEVTFSDSILNVKDLTMQVGETQLAGQGWFNLDTYAYSMNAEGKNLDLAQLSEAAETVRIGGRADLTITGEGLWKDWSDINVNAELQGRGVTIEGRDVGDARLQATTENGLLRLIATGNVLNENRSVEATIDLRERKTLPVNASLEFTDADLGEYLGLIAPELAGISGKATGSIKLTGPLLDENQIFSADRVTAVATFSKLELGGVIAEGQSYTIANQGDVVVRASLNEVSLDKVTFIGESTSITLVGAIARNDPSKSGITVDGEINLGFLSSFSQTVFSTGVAKLQASITGTLDDPRLLGSAELKDIGVRVVDVPLRIARGNGTIRFTANQALLENFMAATPGGGNLTITGGAALTGLVPDRWRFNIEADQVRVTYPRDTNTVFDAELVFQGTRSFLVLAGDAQVRRASYIRDITLEELARTGGPFGPEFLEAGPGGEGPGGLDVRLDVRVEADNTIQIRNNLADAVASAFLHIGGSVSEPLVSGRVQFTRGTLEFRQGRHEITRGLVTLPGRRGADPIVDFQSEADIGGHRVIIGFNGPLNRLRTTLRSDPELPESDIIALVLTGSVSGSDPTEATSTRTGLGLAQSLLAAGLSEQLQKGTQRLFGLSRFSIDPLIVGRSNDPTARITVGQRITKDLTFTYSQNLSGSSELDRIVLVEYRISNRFSIVGFRNDRSELGFDVRFRKRF
jgi:translocation and assembly module TamB